MEAASQPLVAGSLGEPGQSLQGRWTTRREFGPGFSIHEILQARVLEWGAIAFSMTNLDSVLKSRDITLTTNVHLIKAMVFPVVMYGCESWTIKKGEH